MHDSLTLYVCLLVCRGRTTSTQSLLRTLSCTIASRCSSDDSCMPLLQPTASGKIDLTSVLLQLGIPAELDKKFPLHLDASLSDVVCFMGSLSVLSPALPSSKRSNFVSFFVFPFEPSPSSQRCRMPHIMQQHTMHKTIQPRMIKIR